LSSHDPESYILLKRLQRVDFSRIPLPGLQCLCLVSGATLAPVENASCFLVHLDFLPLVIGTAVTGATAGIFLTPIVAPAVLGMVGFGAGGTVAGEPR